MRLSRDELIETFPTWNEERHNIVKALYGDIPFVEWNKAEYERHIQLQGTLSNITAVEAYIWRLKGDYSIYRTLCGDVYISKSGKVLCGDFRVKHGVEEYVIYLALMYGLKSLSIFRNGFSKMLVGFSNSDGLKSPCIKAHTTELNCDVIEKVLSVDLSDYGDSVKKFFEAARKIYEEDKTNHIMEKCWNGVV